MINPPGAAATAGAKVAAEWSPDLCTYDLRKLFRHCPLAVAPRRQSRSIATAAFQPKLTVSRQLLQRAASILRQAR
jgi:hypothetical protein